MQMDLHQQDKVVEPCSDPGEARLFIRYASGVVLVFATRLASGTVGIFTRVVFLAVTVTIF